MKERIHEAGRSIKSIISDMVDEKLARRDGIDAHIQNTDGPYGSHNVPLSTINTDGSKVWGINGSGFVSR